MYPAGSAANGSMPERDSISITPYRDGPLLVRGPFQVLDEQGRQLETRRATIAICRCGRSRLKPLCDGTHKLIGFRADGAPTVHAR